MNSYTCCGIPGLGVPCYILLQFALLGFVWYKAEEYGMDSMTWLIAVFIFGPLAFAIFVILILIQGKGPKRAREEAHAPRASKYQHRAQAQSQPSSLPAEETSARVDMEFRDEQLDRLIEEGRFSKAREYLRDMIQIAREMNDETSLRNYSQYEVRINKAAMNKRRTDKAD